MKIEGKRIVLRNWQEKDAKALKELVDDKTISRFTTVPHPYSLKMAKEFIQRAKKGLRKKDEFDFAITSKESGEIVGSASILRIDYRNEKAEIGYWLAKKERKKGFMTEAVQLLLDHAFKEMKLNRIVINCAVDNEPSRKVIKRASGKFEGIERQSIKNGLGKWQDLRVYSILKKEFK